MPMNNNPDLLQVILAVSAVALSVFIGSLAKIAEEVKLGYRHKFFTKQLWLDVPALFTMIIISWGLVEYLELSERVGLAASTIFGYLGPRILDAVIAYKFNWPKSRNKK